MRVTDGMRYAGVLGHLKAASAEHARAASEASSGSRLASPASDPAAYAYVLRQRADASRAGAARSALSLALGDAQAAEGALAEASDIFVRARELAVQGSNGSLNAEQRGALAEDVAGLRQQLIALANTKGSRGSLFAGSKTGTPAFDPSGAFAGDDELQRIDLGPLGAATVGVSGATTFTAAGGRDVFADLSALESALRANDTTLVQASLDGLDAARVQVQQGRGQAGSIMAKLESSDVLLEQTELTAARNEERSAAVSPFEAYSRFVLLSQSLERSVEVSRQLLAIGGLYKF